MATIPVQADFQKVVEDLLFPLFPGIKIKRLSLTLPRYNGIPLVAIPERHSSRILRLMPDSKSTYAIYVTRSQSFHKDERRLMTNLLMKSERLYQDMSKPYYNETKLSVISDSISAFLSDNSSFIHKLLITFSEWAQLTYEGQKIAISFGVENQNSNDGDITFDEICSEDFTKVLSNGHDTILVFSINGNFLHHDVINNVEVLKDKYYPIRFVNLAGWSLNDRICLTLTRNGEILIFKDGNLLFAKRRGTWSYYLHDVVQRQFTNSALAKNTMLDLRREIYNTSLDLSFSKTGGCIGVFNLSLTKEGTEDLIIEKERFKLDSTIPKVKLLERVINNKPFNEIPRLLRQEIASIDGATVLNWQGHYIAAGVIVKVQGGSTSGGRIAATKALSKYGLGIKISNDGYIEAYNRKQKILFRLG